MDRKEQIDTRTELLQEASLALRALRLRHEAARYEAEAIELEAILERAKGGDRGELERWLARHRMTMDAQGGEEPSRRKDASMPSLERCEPRDPPRADAETLPRTHTDSRYQRSSQPSGSPVQENPWQMMILAAERRSLVPRSKQRQPAAPFSPSQPSTAESKSMPSR
ncbi:MAG: hypothetical protein ACK56G_05220 [Pirellulaceae bacterium]